MAFRLTLLCHAATAAMRAGAFPADDPLDGPGLAAATRGTGKLASAGTVWSSPALAARQTAQALGLVPGIEPALRDLDYGRWTGRTLDQVQAAEPVALTDWLTDPGKAPHGGETGLALVDRLGAWMDGQSRNGGRALAITHASVIRAALIYTLGASVRSFGHIDVVPLTMTSLSCHAGHWRLRRAGACL
jgi:broad specificity phosphatase PhoE